MANDLSKIPSFLKPEHYTYVGEYNSLPFGAYFWASWYSDEIGNKLGIRINHGGWLQFVGKKENTHVFYRKDQIEKTMSLFKGKIKKGDFEFFEEIYKNALGQFEKSVLAIKDIENSDKSFPDNFNSIVDNAKKILFYWNIGWQFSQVIDSFVLENSIPLGINNENIQKYLQSLSTPMVLQQKEARELKNVLVQNNIWDPKNFEQVKKNINKKSEIKEKINIHLEKYKWITFTDWNGDFLSLDELLEQLSHLSDENSAELIYDNLLIEKYKPVFLCGVLNQLGSEYLSIFSAETKNILSNISKKMSINYDDLLFLLPNEIIDFKNKGNKLKEIIERRKKKNAVVYTDADNSVKIIDDPASIEVWSKKFLPKRYSGRVKKINGQIGYEGKVSGRVVIIRSKEDFHKMRKGLIIVAPMTTPEYVLIMQKSGAIITDMGGVLSHATIVSREMKKPCIIGTKIATQVLKDGDFVEVDANSGIIRIIK